MNPILVLASASILNLQCVGEDRSFDFTLDLQSKSGEMIYTVSGADNLYLSDRMTVTPNYISFPYSSTAVTINRKNSTYTLGIGSGVCEVVDREIDTIF